MEQTFIIVEATMFTLATGWAAWVSKTLIKILTESEGVVWRVTKVEDDMKHTRAVVDELGSDVDILEVKVRGLEAR